MKEAKQTDPSARHGNKRTGILSAAVAAGTLMLMGAGYSAAANSAPSPRPEISTPAEKKDAVESLNHSAQGMAELMAEQAIAANKAGTGKGSQIDIHDTKIPGEFLIDITYNAGANKAVNDGVYQLEVTLQKDENDEFDPSTVRQAAIWMVSAKVGSEAGSVNGKQALFGYTLQIDGVKGGWTIFSDETTNLNSPSLAQRFDLTQPMGDRNTFNPINEGYLQALNTRATNVLQQAAQGAPVSFPPAIN